MKARDDGSTSVSSTGSVARSTADVLDKKQESNSRKRRKLRTIVFNEEERLQIEKITKRMLSHRNKPSSEEEKRIVWTAVMI